MSKKKSYIIMVSILLLGIVVDLVTKIIFANALSGKDGATVVIPNFFELVYVENTGAAYGMFGGSTVLLIIITIAFIIGFCVYDYFNHSINWWYMLGLSLIVSGAIGNFIDRIFLGYVRDFLSIKLFSFVFNIADLLITVGVGCFIVYMIICIIKETKDKKGKDIGVDNK